MRGGHCLKAWSSTQKAVALSSGESELLAAVKASCEATGLAQMAQDIGCPMEAEILVDSSAALGAVNRRGKASSDT